MDALATTIGLDLADELSSGMESIRHCVDQLSQEQIWWRPREEMNSIANLMLHIAGNIRQWIVSAVGGAADIRDRPAKFSTRGGQSKTEVLAHLEQIVAEAKAVLLKQGSESWLRPREVQRHRQSGFGTALHSVSHFRGHAQEIIHMTRAQLGTTYRFAGPTATQQQ